jgi:hypothetical protein
MNNACDRLKYGGRDHARRPAAIICFGRDLSRMGRPKHAAKKGGYQYVTRAGQSKHMNRNEINVTYEYLR